MVLTATGLNVPAQTEPFDPATDFADLAASMEGRIIVPVANVAARAALVTAVSPTTAEPLFVYRADAAPGLQLEVTTNGTTWAAVAQESGVGWTLAGVSFVTGWSQSASVGGWRPLAYRQIGSLVRLNGVAVKNVAWGVNDIVLTMPTALWPTGVFQGLADGIPFDVQQNGTVRVLAGHAAGVIGIDISWIIG